MQRQKVRVQLDLYYSIFALCEMNQKLKRTQHLTTFLKLYDIVTVELLCLFRPFFYIFWGRQEGASFCSPGEDAENDEANFWRSSKEAYGCPSEGSVHGSPVG